MLRAAILAEINTSGHQLDLRTLAQRLGQDEATVRAAYEALLDDGIIATLQARKEPLRVAVSYAWESATVTWVDELERALPPPFRLYRDKNGIRPGDWISNFMKEIGRSRDVVVVLSNQYLHSRYCMRELLYLHDRHLGERAELMQRIVPVVIDGLKIGEAVDRLTQVVRPWQERQGKLQAMIDQVGIAAGGGAARDELLEMGAIIQHADKLLAWLNDVLMPRARQGDGQQTIQAVIEVLRERAKKVR
jgi:hypothetical protein